MPTYLRCPRLAPFLLPAVSCLAHLVVLLFPLYSTIHCGVVGNIQAFHVCAPGSIPGDGVFIFVRTSDRPTLSHCPLLLDTDHSSVGRAEDCSLSQISLGHWFESGWSDPFLFLSVYREIPIPILQRDRERYSLILRYTMRETETERERERCPPI